MTQDVENVYAVSRRLQCKNELFFINAFQTSQHFLKTPSPSVLPFVTGCLVTILRLFMALTLCCFCKKTVCHSARALQDALQKGHRSHAGTFICGPCRCYGLYLTKTRPLWGSAGVLSPCFDRLKSRLLSPPWSSPCPLIWPSCRDSITAVGATQEKD